MDSALSKLRKKKQKAPGVIRAGLALCPAPRPAALAGLSSAWGRLLSRASVPREPARPGMAGRGRCPRGLGRGQACPRHGDVQPGGSRLGCSAGSRAALAANTASPATPEKGSGPGVYFNPDLLTLMGNKILFLQLGWPGRRGPRGGDGHLQLTAVGVAGGDKRGGSPRVASPAWGRGGAAWCEGSL